MQLRKLGYDPVTGRFASEDPAEHGTNWYAYADACPTGFVDVSGRAPFGIGDVSVAQGIGDFLDGTHGGGAVVVLQYAKRKLGQIFLSAVNGAIITGMKSVVDQWQHDGSVEALAVLEDALWGALAGGMAAALPGPAGRVLGMGYGRSEGWAVSLGAADLGLALGILM